MHLGLWFSVPCAQFYSFRGQKRTVTGQGRAMTGPAVIELNFYGRCFNTENSMVQFGGQQAEEREKEAGLPSNHPLTEN